MVLNFIDDGCCGYIQHLNELEAYSVFSFMEDGLQKVKLMLGTSLHYSQSSCSPVVNPMGEECGVLYHACD